MAQKTIDFKYLQDIIISGIKNIQINAVFKEAVLFLGDTGVGKSTLMTYLLGESLKICQIGLKPSLCGPENSKVKIGHDKYSQTSVPNQIIINSKVFYDCPGFNDNKSEESDIANSFYLQRLFDLYDQTKIVLVIDQTYLTEARAHRLPELIKKLNESFGDLSQIRESTILVINRCSEDFDEIQIKDELMKLLYAQNLRMFNTDSKDFLSYLIQKEQYMTFPCPSRSQIGQIMAPSHRPKLFNLIDKIQFLRNIRMNKIVSDSAKLAIRDFVQSMSSAQNVQYLHQIFDKIEQFYKQYKNQCLDQNQLLRIKQQLMQITINSKAQINSKHNFTNFVDFCIWVYSKNHDTQLNQKINKLKQQLHIAQFFNGVCDKTSSYYDSLANVIISRFSLIIRDIDINIQQKKKQRQRLEEQRRQRLKIQQQKIRRLKQQQERDLRIQLEQQRIQNIKRLEEQRAARFMLEQSKLEAQRLQRKEQQRTYKVKSEQSILRQISNLSNRSNISKQKSKKSVRITQHLTASCSSSNSDNTIFINIDSGISTIPKQQYGHRKLYTMGKIPAPTLFYSQENQEDILKCDNPILAFKKRLVDAEYNMHQLRFEGEVLSAKMKIYSSGFGGPNK